MTDKLIEAARRLWPAYEIFVSAGSAAGAFDRYIWPVVREIRAALREIDASEYPGPTFAAYAVGFRDSDKPGSYGMFFGPCPTIEECEVYEPFFEHGVLHRRCYIFFFDGEGGQHIIAEWRDGGWEASVGA